MQKKKSGINVIYIIMGILFVYQLVFLGVLIATYEKISVSMVGAASFFLILGIIIDGIVFYVCKSILHKLEMDEKLKELYRYRELETQMYQNIQHQMKELREKRHEFSNQIQTVYIMVEQNVSRETLEKYLAELEKSYQMDAFEKMKNE